MLAEQDGHLVGAARLDDANEHHRHATYAIGIRHPDDWGCGYGTEATRLVLQHAFDVLGLHRIDLVVLGTNSRAVRAYEKCRFRKEGVLREQALIQGQWHDDLIMSVLDTEYRRSAGRDSG